MNNKGNKHVFWQALILTVAIFGMGIMLGFYLEDSREGKVQSDLISSEIKILDEQLRNKVISDFSVSCDLAKESTFDFADDIFDEAEKLEIYEASSTFENDLHVLHKRYDLLRTLLWSNAIETRQKCNEDFHTVVYLYEYATEDPAKRAEQTYFSRILTDLKNENPEEVLLIPIAANMDLESVNILLKQHNIDSLPSIIIDERLVIDERVSLEDLIKLAS